ncbi:unnamed protein product (mitochondrion) [Plasmodiophora brassicae]|uniref:Intimal thickness related receptor IRP domain-containing protein n=1 Tax=Plasmodiophora brassicae TaxID=37360 RepID=A0A3P3YAT9_PLABS|nr:unnamed protein product [Plasmodiophora brassicae]
MVDAVVPTFEVRSAVVHVLLHLLLFRLSCAVVVLDGNLTAIGDGIPSPNYRLGNNSFTVSAPFYVVPADDHRHYTLESTPTSSKIVIVDFKLAGAANRWADACQAVSCSGVMFINGAANQMHSYYAYTFRLTSPTPFTNVPIVVIDLTQTPAFLATIASPRAVYLRIRSGDFNEAQFQDENKPAIWWSKILTLVLCLFSLLSCAIQLTRFLFDSEWRVRAIPLVPAIVIFLETLASSFRGLHALNTTLLKTRGLSMGFTLYAELACMAFNYLSVGAVSYAAYESLTASEPPSLKRKLAMTIGLSFLGVLFIADQAQIIITAVTLTDLMDSTYLSLLYLLCDIAASFAFIIFGGRLAKQLHSTTTKLSSGERARREQFSRRVRLSGWMGFLVALTLILFAIFNSTSFDALNTLYWMIQDAFTLAGLVHVWAFRPRQSAVDKFLKWSRFRSTQIGPPDNSKGAPIPGPSTSKQRTSFGSKG